MNCFCGEDEQKQELMNIMHNIMLIHIPVSRWLWKGTHPLNKHFLIFKDPHSFNIKKPLIGAV